MSLGQRIKMIRKSRGMTQEVLGNLVGLSGVAIMRYEKDQREPNQEIVTKIANALDVSELTLRRLEPTLNSLEDYTNEELLTELNKLMDEVNRRLGL